MCGAVLSRRVLSWKSVSNNGTVVSPFTYKAPQLPQNSYVSLELDGLQAVQPLRMRTALVSSNVKRQMEYELGVITEDSASKFEYPEKHSERFCEDPVRGCQPYQSFDHALLTSSVASLICKYVTKTIDSAKTGFYR